MSGRQTGACSQDHDEATAVAALYDGYFSTADHAFVPDHLYQSTELQRMRAVFENARQLG